MVACIGFVTLVACQTDPSKRHNDVAQNNPPQSIAVLPFQNKTETEGLAALVRNSIYGHLSVLPYRDIEISTIDNRLRKHNMMDRAVLPKTSVQKLGRLLGCDAVLMGEVTDFQRIFAAIYSQMAVTASIQIWDTRSGQKIWADEYTARIHEGGIPLDIILVPLISLRTGWNMREAVKIQAVDELSQYMVDRIPSPQFIEQSIYQCELQVGAFLEDRRAQALVKRLEDKGYKPFIRNNRDDRGLWHRVLMGPYDDHEKVALLRARIHKELGVDSFICNVYFGPNKKGN